ncbi:MAG: tRNA lysidine(34) synthetase TilS, partial [Lactobacillus crispatus]|nr:tRNA lysidine(34) synthetase TilS [Lactobacillus crispatus]
PLLKEENPNLISNALRFSEKMSQLTDLADEQLNSMRTVEPFLGAWRIKTDNLNDLSTEEKNIFWQKIIWQKYHRRVNENLGNFEVIDYQGYSYLVENKPQKIVQPFSIELNQQFEFNGAYY